MRERERDRERNNERKRERKGEKERGIECWKREARKKGVPKSKSP